MPRSMLGAVAVLMLLAPSVSTGAPPVLRAGLSKTLKLGHGAPGKVAVRMPPYSCYILTLSARSKGKGASPVLVPLNVQLAVGKVMRRLRTGGEPLVQRHCTGSNGLSAHLVVTCASAAVGKVRFERVALGVQSRRKDPGRQTWTAARSLFLGPLPRGFDRSVLAPRAALLGKKRGSLQVRMNLASGQCYRLQAVAVEGGKLSLAVQDADDKPLLLQPLDAPRYGPATSRPFCPVRTEAHRLELTAPREQAVAWRILARPLPAAAPPAPSPEMAPCLRKRVVAPGRLACPGTKRSPRRR